MPASNKRFVPSNKLMRMISMLIRLPLRIVPGSTLLTVVFSLQFPTESTVQLVSGKSTRSMTVQELPAQSSEVARTVEVISRLSPLQPAASPPIVSWRFMSPSSAVLGIPSAPFLLYAAANLPLPLVVKVHDGSDSEIELHAGKLFEVEVSGAVHWVNTFTSSPFSCFACFGVLCV